MQNRQEGEKPGVPNIPKFRFKDIDSDLEHEILLLSGMRERTTFVRKI